MNFAPPNLRSLQGPFLWCTLAWTPMLWAEIRDFDPTAEGPWSDVEKTTLTVPLIPNGSVTMDGTVSQEEYGNFPGQLVDPGVNAWILDYPGDRQWDGPEDSSFTFWLAHDEEFFYVGVVAKDEVINQDDPTSLWKDDSIEIVVDALNDRYDINTDNSNDPYGGHNYVSYNGRFSDWDHEGGNKGGRRWSSEVDWAYGEQGEVWAVGSDQDQDNEDGHWHLDIRFAKSIFEDPEAGNRLENGYVMGFNIGMDDDDKFGPGENGDRSRSLDLELQYWWANRLRLLGWNAEEAENYEPAHIANGDHEEDFETGINSGGRLTHGGTGEIIFASDNPFELAPGPNITVSSRKSLGKLSTENPSYSEVIAVRNTGTENALTLSSVTLGGPDGELFEVDEFPATIAPQRQADIKFTFRPDGRTGNFSALLEIASDDVDLDDRMRVIEITASVVNLQGPMAQFSLDEAAGSTVMVDVSGHGRHGTYDAGGGTLALAQEALASGTAIEVSGGALGRVDGRHLDFESFTVSMWFRSEGGDGFQTLFAQGEPEGTPTYALLASGGNLAWFVGEETVFETSHGEAYAIGHTHHLAVSYGHVAPEKAVIYVDAVEVTSRQGLNPLAIGRDSVFVIGSYFDARLPFRGRIDDVQLYDRALSAEEVTWLRDHPGMVIGQRQPGGDLILGQVGLGTGGRIAFSLPDDATADIEYSTDLIHWKVIVPGAMGTFEETDAGRTEARAGYYRARR